MSMNIIFGVAGIAILIMSAVIHEVSHGVVAEHLGDPTARLQGRLTLNPLKHLDPVGSFLVPILLWLSTGLAFGWAKPVPYNPNNLRDPLRGAAKIAVAGPISNIVVAVIFGIAIRIFAATGLISPLLLVLFGIIVEINIVLAVFNLVPIPPLDGSKVFFAFLPRTESAYRLMYFLERYGMFIVLFFAFFGFQLIIPIIRFLFVLIAGQSFGF